MASQRQAVLDRIPLLVLILAAAVVTGLFMLRVFRGDAPSVYLWLGAVVVAIALLVAMKR